MRGQAVSTVPKQGKRRVEVQILGQRMMLKAEGDPQRIERLAAYVRRKVDEVASHGPISSQKLAILAALNIADEYFRAIDEMRELKRQVAVKSRALLNDLDP
jgi:cell division protein ZapA